MTYHKVELNDRQISILRTALDTRLQRIEEMIKLFQEPGTKNGEWMEEQYCKESLDVEYLQQMFSVNFLPAPKSQVRESLQEKAYKVCN